MQYSHVVDDAHPELECSEDQSKILFNSKVLMARFNMSRALIWKVPASI
jgi:hypothetical protein